jgi:hypothetical protein
MSAPIKVLPDKSIRRNQACPSSRFWRSPVPGYEPTERFVDPKAAAIFCELHASTCSTWCARDEFPANRWIGHAVNAVPEARGAMRYFTPAGSTAFASLICRDLQRYRQLRTIDKFPSFWSRSVVKRVFGGAKWRTEMAVWAYSACKPRVSGRLGLSRIDPNHATGNEISCRLGR